METTLTSYRSSSMKVPPALVLLAFALALIVIVYGTHAVAKHGTGAEAVRRCMNDTGPIETWVSMKTGRQYHVCKIDQTTFGIMITDGTREVTAFIKEKLTRLSQVQQWLRNCGAEKIYYH
jgi:hypothetical protein